MSGTVSPPGLGDFISLSPSMQQLLALVERVVPSDVSLLILGETGVGKEHLARAIHTAGPRAAQSFIPVNCGAIPENLLESELFGHEAGAFTGAIRQHKGMFALAHKGTLFLDEIGEMPYHLQVKLLRALQSQEILPVGGEDVQQVDVRVMAASNRELELEVKEGRFRQDLFYRLSVLPLTIPPLRQRVEDIPLLAGRFLEHFGTAAGRHMTSMDSETMTAFARYQWPGNIRELMNVLERGVLVSSGTSLTLADLPEELSGGGDGVKAVRPAVGPGRPGMVAGDEWVAGGRSDGVEAVAPTAGPGVAGTGVGDGRSEASGFVGAAAVTRGAGVVGGPPVTPGAVTRPGETVAHANGISTDRHLVARPLRDVRKEAVEELDILTDGHLGAA